MKRTVVGQQGEVKIYRIDAIPEDAELTRSVERNQVGEYIISHSETGNHHVIGAGADVMERTNKVPAGMRIIYALLDNPDKIRQDASYAHDTIALDGGSIYEFRVSREYDPFAEQARVVSD